MEKEELDQIETRVLVWSTTVNPQRRKDAVALISEVRRLTEALAVERETSKR